MTENKQQTNEKNSLIKWAKAHKVAAVLIIALAAITVFRLITFGMDLANPTVEEGKIISVRVSEAEYTSIAKASPLSGRISPVEEAAIVPLAAGKVTAVHVKVGDYVKAGTVLFELDKSTVASQYNQAKAAYDLAKSSYANMTVLYNEGAISKADYDAVYVQYVQASEGFKAASEAYSYYNVSTPIDGYVTSLNVSVGNLAGSNMAASVANTDELQIQTTISEYMAGLISQGDVVDVYVEALGSEPYSGTVTALSPAPALGTLTYPITITLDNASGDLMSGMFAEIQIKSEESAEAVCVPSDAVIVKNGVSIVVSLDDEDIPIFNEVTTGIDNGEMVEILSGIEAGQRIVVSGQDFVTEGLRVNVID